MSSEIKENGNSHKILYTTLDEAKKLGKTSRDIFHDFNSGRLMPQADVIGEGVYYDMFQHYLMLADSSRMLHYKRGIFEKNKIKGKVVLDAGSGFGILALWCAQAGAKKVYAVEITDNYKHIIEAAKANGLSDIVEVIHDDALLVDLPEKVDVIVSEPIGMSIIAEGMFTFLCSVRDKYLKPDGEILPCGGNLYISAISDPDFAGRIESFFQNFKAMYGVKMNHLIPRARDSLSSRAFQKSIRKHFLRSEPAMFKTLDFKTMSFEEANCVYGDYDLEIVSDGLVHGFSIFFDILFPNGTLLDTSPLSQPTHWKSTVCYFKEPKNLQQGQKITGTVKLRVVENIEFFIDVTLEYRIDDEPLETNEYCLGFDRGQLINLINFDIDPN
ncbi:DgyrCDS6222 [Dimorphilus gyrociliatus]|uniref:Protein arginine N-methyltransferase 6 n=1 Tax=Dimorphilus gyrociliatus TaxID=2664684 RepID=A0A7I8VME2_9ANNE|nr:DgyrCDS6222 [Dimorphilus gyrociliatus]